MSNTEFNQSKNYNNKDLRCGELLTIRLNCSHYETLYIEKHEQDEESQMTGINYKDDAHAEAIWSEINTRATYLYEKVWSKTWERTEEILYVMEEIFNYYNVEFDYSNEDSEEEEELPTCDCEYCGHTMTICCLDDNDSKCDNCGVMIDEEGCVSEEIITCAECGTLNKQEELKEGMSEIENCSECGKKFLDHWGNV